MKTLLALVFATTAAFAAEPAITATDAFAAIKKLQGDWRGVPMMKGMPAARSIYRLTAGGSAVEETIFPGTQMEMVFVYHMDKGDLLMTHYCMLGNQPQLKFNARKSTPSDLYFDFAGGTNLNPRRDAHMHSLHLTLPAPTKSGPSKLTVSGASWEGGKEKAAGCTSTLTRRK